MKYQYDIKFLKIYTRKKHSKQKTTKLKIITLQKTNINKQYTLAVLNALKQVMYSTCNKISKTIII